MTNPQEVLVAQVRSLYARLHANALEASDTVRFDDVRFDDLGGYVRRIYSSQEEFERSFSEFRAPYDIFRAFPAGKVVLDIGAHWGYSAVAMRHQGCKARIISIEAMRSNASALNALKELDKGNYDWFNVAVGAQENILTFYIPMLNGHAATGLSSTGGTLDDFFADHLAGLAQTYPSRRADGVNEIKLAVNRIRGACLDTILLERGDIAPHVAAVKMDVEGHEAPALEGAASLFTTQKPLLMLEGANRNQQATSVMMGYGYFHCERHEGRLTPHLAYSYANDGFWVHPDRVEEYRSLGLFEGRTPTPAEVAIPPETDGVVRKGSAGQG